MYLLYVPLRRILGVLDLFGHNGDVIVLCLIVLITPCLELLIDDLFQLDAD